MGDNILNQRIVYYSWDRHGPEITKTFYDTYEYLNNNGRGSVSVLVLAGSWVEALYISTHISEDTYNNVEMIKIIMEQKEPLNKLMDGFAILTHMKGVN